MSTDPAASPRRSTILVVDDAEDTRELWALVFRQADFRVFTARSMAEGLAFLDGDDSIDVILTDYWLRDGTAEALLRRAADAGVLRGARALICTAHTAVTMSACAPVVHKPILPEDLVAHVRELLPVTTSDGRRVSGVRSR